MSVNLSQPPSASNGHERKPAGVRTYRGRRVEDLIPQIRAELGDDAIILRQREGLMGGVGGFFAQRFVEVEAQPGGPRFDVYDTDGDDGDGDAYADHDRAAESFADELARAGGDGDDPEARFENDDAAMDAEDLADAPEPRGDTPVERSAALPPEGGPHPDDAAPPEEPAAPTAEADALEPAAVEVEPAPGLEPEGPAPVADTPPTPARAAGRRRRPVPALPVSRRRTRRAGKADAGETAKIAAELLASGLSQDLVDRLIRDAAAHGTPFTSDAGLRDGVRAVLARSIPQAPALSADGAAIAFVGAGGAGKTRAAAALATAYRRGSSLPVSVLSLAGADRGRGLAALLRSEGVTVRSATSARTAAKRIAADRAAAVVIVDTTSVIPRDSGSVTALAGELEPLALDGVYLAVPATLSPISARQLVQSLAPLRPAGLVVTHIDETDQLGVAVELACSTRTPIAYLHEGLDLASAMSAADPLRLAARLLS